MLRKVLPSVAIGAVLLYLGASWMVFAALLIVGLVLQWSLRRTVKRAGRKAIDALPATIRLASEHPAAWRHVDQVRSAIAELRKLGFAPAGEFSVPEMPGVLVAGFANVEHSLYAAVCEHPTGIVWTDLGGEYTDGTSLTATNAPAGDELDSIEGTVRIRAKGAPAETLLRRAREAGMPMPLRPVDPAMFKLTFERAYARDTAKRKQRPLSNREADRFLDKVGKRADTKADAEHTTVGV
jgi:hypothetical protein